MQIIKCPSKGHNTVSLVNLYSSTPRSQVEHSTTELLLLRGNIFKMVKILKNT